MAIKNTFFQFQQFKIEQKKSSMKVCTDSCLFGAWVAEKIIINTINPTNILDIGAGTGLLSLMLAQKINAAIDAIEIDTDSFQQTQENFGASPWQGRLQVYNNDITKMDLKKQYDFIICNPPFFEGDLKSETQSKNLAKHHDGLTLEELVDQIKNNLDDRGQFAVLLPFHRVEYFKNLAGNAGFFLAEELLAKQTPRHNYFRGLLLFSRTFVEIKTESLCIRDENNDYSSRFNQLLNHYYLNK